MVRIVIILFISLLPILIYCFLYYKAKKKALALDLDPPFFITEGLLKVFIQFLIIASTCFIVFVFISLYEEKSGKYIPAKVVDGKIERGHIEEYEK